MAGSRVRATRAAIQPRHRYLAAFLAVAALLVAPTVSAQDLPKLPCADADKDCARRAMKHHAATGVASWQAMQALSAAERIGPAPPQLVEYINLDNIANGYPERPRAG